ncbi:hypothetical protein IO99_17975 [Clostridium sulfidigenes]|uniref:HTH cro/C1-type domain-containing protein n=1 Tax=Clostridium sulfidigenes TaxID=318464 RepID=A0A084J7F5_9CLOT|nr:helix-turn-helix transcriptional regulator [Clostridium sulfidigenes]KEZ84889.1 hypothetical protein IO99_17975 [Clostridium sulfidigenes]
MQLILKQIRERENKTQKQLSEDSGISVSYIQKLETGDKKRPSYEIVLKLAAALNSSVEELFLSSED